MAFARSPAASARSSAAARSCASTPRDSDASARSRSRNKVFSSSSVASAEFERAACAISVSCFTFCRRRLLRRSAAARPFRSATTRSIQRSACFRIAAGAAASPRASADAADSHFSKPKPNAPRSDVGDACGRAFSGALFVPFPLLSQALRCLLATGGKDGFAMTAFAVSGNVAFASCDASFCADRRRRAPAPHPLAAARGAAPSRVASGATLPLVLWPFDKHCPSASARSARKGEPEDAARSRARPARPPVRSAASAFAASRMARSATASGTGLCPRSAAAEGDESAASAIALTPVSAGATGVSYAWCLCAGARGGLPPFPARLVVFAAATCFSPLPGFFARAGGWTRTRFAGGGLWKRSGTFALRFRRPPSGATARGGVAAGVAMADITSRALRTFWGSVAQSKSDLGRGDRDSAPRGGVSSARVERTAGTSP